MDKLTQWWSDNRCAVGYMFNDRLPCFECEDGWFDLLGRLTRDIASVDKTQSVRVSQVKEKYGTLRFYIVSGTDKIYDLIDQYEQISGHTCEMCGSAGRLCRTSNGYGWYKTLCESCMKTLKYKPCNQEE